MNNKIDLNEYKFVLDLTSVYFDEIKSIIDLSYNDIVQHDKKSMKALLHSVLILCEKGTQQCEKLLAEEAT